ncbi:MAG: ABC transporter substrate-binding protein [Neglectibacter timonensis]|uniref:ABC transporter substrate-binding protein n=1 Tax=Neglectibacter timonensis TaxID=1776382 RepID=UPI0039945A61
MKKRIVSAILATAMVATLFAGCSNNNSSSTSSAAKDDSSSKATSSTTESGAESTPAGNDGAKVEIEFLQQKREAVDTFDALIQEFQKQNPNITVTQNTVPDAGTVLMTRAASNEMPDVLTHWPTDAAYIQFATQGRLKDLTDNACMDNVIDSYKESIKLDGKYYTVPISLNFMGVFYDVDKFKDGGYEVPKTWDEFINLAKDIQGKGEVAFVLPDKDSWTISQGWDNIGGKDRGGEMGKFYDELRAGTTTYQDDPIAVDSMEKMIELREYSQGDTLSLGYDQAINDFATGTGYMFIQGIWALPSIESANPDKNVAMFPMPNDKGDMKQPLGVDVAICAGADTTGDKADAVDKFLLYLSSTEAAQMYSDKDHSPSCIKGVEAQIPQAQAVLDLIDTAGVLDISAPPAGFEETKRSKLQQVLIDKDVNAFLTTMTEGFLAAAASEQ